jgi:biotin carboxyl carrier protein
MLKVKVNNAFEGEVIKNEDNQFVLNNIAYQPDICKTADGRFHILLDNKSYVISNVAKEGKQLTFRMNHKTFVVNMKDKYDILLDSLGLDFSASNKIEDVKAPMPGLVLKVLVTPGEEVKKDTPLIILEAMKMENIIKAVGDGVVGSILVEEKNTVEKGQKLITFN